MSQRPGFRISHGLAVMFKPTDAKVFSASVYDVEDGRRVVIRSCTENLRNAGTLQDTFCQAQISIPIDQYRRVEFLEYELCKNRIGTPSNVDCRLLVSKLLFKQHRGKLQTHFRKLPLQYVKFAELSKPKSNRPSGQWIQHEGPPYTRLFLPNWLRFF